MFIFIIILNLLFIIFKNNMTDVQEKYLNKKLNEKCRNH